MTTLNEIAENIAYKLGDQFNHTLKESIKDTLINYRAKFIRDDLDKNSTSDVHFHQVGTIQFEVINLLTAFNADYSSVTSVCTDVLLQENYKVLRSIQDIPTPLRSKASSRIPFSYLGRVDGSKNFIYTTLDKYVYIKTLPYSLNTIYYTIINSKVYILNNLSKCDVNDTLGICNVLFKGIFENPRDFYDVCNNTDIFIDDLPFPIGRDMLMSISNNILKGEYPLVNKDGKEVHIKKDNVDI